MSEKILVEDPEDGSVTRLLRGLPGGELKGGVCERWEETYFLEGTAELDGEVLAAGSYTCLAPGSDRRVMSTVDGFVALQTVDINKKLDKPNVVLRADEIDAMSWQTTPLRNAAHLQKILAQGPSGSVTRLLRVDVDGDTTELDDHPFDEEVWIVEGTVKNGEEYHVAGTYTFNRPHDTHGPFLIGDPLLCFEIRNYS